MYRDAMCQVLDSNYPKAKFSRGDIVSITSKLPKSMSHFLGGRKAVVLECDAKECADDDRVQYKLLIYVDQDKNLWETHAWYDESLLIGLWPGIDNTNEVINNVRKWMQKTGSQV